MILTLKKGFSFGNIFTVTDEYGNNLYKARRRKDGGLFSDRSHIYLYSSQDNAPVAFFSRIPQSYAWQYTIGIHNQTLRVGFAMYFRTVWDVECEFAGINWTMQGNYGENEFTISDQNGLIMRMSGKKLSSGQTYVWLIGVSDKFQLEIPNPENELICLAVAMIASIVIESVDK